MTNIWKYGVGQSTPLWPHPPLTTIWPSFQSNIFNIIAATQNTSLQMNAFAYLWQANDSFPTLWTFLLASASLASRSFVFMICSIFTNFSFRLTLTWPFFFVAIVRLWFPKFQFETFEVPGWTLACHIPSEPFPIQVAYGGFSGFSPLSPECLALVFVRLPPSLAYESLLDSIVGSYRLEGF